MPYVNDITTPMLPEDDFIRDFLPILRKYLRARGIDNLEKQLDQIQEGLDAVAKTVAAEASADAEDSASSGDNEQIGFDIMFDDLKPDVQKFIAESLGYESTEEFKLTHFDGPIFTL